MNPTPDLPENLFHDLPDEALMLEIRRLWETLDPPPGDLADGVLATLAAIDLEFEFERHQPGLDLQVDRGPGGRHPVGRVAGRRVGGLPAGTVVGRPRVVGGLGPGGVGGPGAGRG